MYEAADSQDAGSQVPQPTRECLTNLQWMIMYFIVLVVHLYKYKFVSCNAVLVQGGERSWCTSALQ